MICTPATAGRCAPQRGDEPRHRRGATDLGARPKIADALPAEDPDRAAMRITPRTMLCGIAWRVHANVAGDRFDELRELCTTAGDKRHWPSEWLG